MIRTYDLKPVRAGVVYSPEGKGWVFYPEERLLVGLTGSVNVHTNVRSVLAFEPPELDTEIFLLRACLTLRVLDLQPLDQQKLVCLRETPAGVEIPWTIGDELRQPVLAEHRLAAQLGHDLEFCLTGLVEAWRRGAPNHGVLLDFGTADLGLVTFANGHRGEPAAVLWLVLAFPATDVPIVTMEIEADSAAESRELPCRDLVVKNIGPGLAWVTPLYRLAGEPLFDPAGIPLAVLEPGAHVLVKPRVPAKVMSVRIGTVMSRTAAVVIPLADGAGGEAESP